MLRTTLCHSILAVFLLAFSSFCLPSAGQATPPSSSASGEIKTHGEDSGKPAEAQAPQDPLQTELDLNQRLGQDLERLAEEQAALTTRLESQKKRLKELEEEFALNRKRVEHSVLTQTLSLTLRKQRQALPSISQYRRDSAQRQKELAQVSEALLVVEERLRTLTRPAAERDRILLSLGPLPSRDAAVQRTTITALLRDRKALLEKLEAGYRRYVNDLQTLEFTEQQLALTAREYADFLDAHLLWIRSSRLLRSADFRNIPTAVFWAIHPLNWFGVLKDLGEGFLRSPASWVLGLLSAALLFAGRPRFKKNLSKIALSVREDKAAPVWLTLKAMVITLSLALTLPFFLGFIGYQLFSTHEADEFSRAVGGGLLSAAQTLAVLAFLYHFCRHDGMAEIHFAWPEEARQSLRHNVLWIIQVLIPLSFMVGMIETQGNDLYRDSLGRIASVAAWLAVAAFFMRLLQPSGVIVCFWRRGFSRHWIFKLRALWVLVLVGIPILVAGLVVAGYLYTASVLHGRYNATVLLILCLSLAHGLVMKAITGALRRVEHRGIQDGIEAGQDAAASPKGESVELRTPAQRAEDAAKSIKDLDQQSRSLVRIFAIVLGLFFLWTIWAPVLPALKLVGGMPLWTYGTDVDGVRKALPITLAHVVTALVTAGITTVAAKNLPGILQLLFLNRLPLDQGARYAVQTLLRYAVMVIGIIATFSALGLRWSSIQWLVAALSLGLGFGLQEIVANFVCGLIILFERPFRVGDVITIGDQTGRVTRIQIRATTVMDWDRRELIVPNKEFITGKLINWSLSDPITRVVIPVGVAYGSDTKMTEELLLKVARENPMVLRQPEPSALFLGFGDNSLNFELRVFVRGMDHRLPVTHQLHLAIDGEFRKAGINIAFPQRDIHLDTTRPVEVCLVRDPKANSDKSS